MTTRAFSKPQYIATMVGKMTDITASGQSKVDIWPYAELLVKEKLLSPHVLKNKLVELIYRNQDETFDHMLLPTSYINNFVVIIADLRSEKVAGHFLLDLNGEYGIHTRK